jgi:hypothetical protein
MNMAVRNCGHADEKVPPEKESIFGKELFDVLCDIKTRQNYLTNIVIWLLREKRIMLPMDEISTKDIIEYIRDRDDITICRLRAGKLSYLESDKDAIALIYENDETI